MSSLMTPAENLTEGDVIVVDIKSPSQHVEIIPLPSRGDIESSAPYNLEELPFSISAAAAEISRFDMVPEASPAVIGLAVLATAIGKKAVIEERSGHDHYPALFFALIAASGERKSPSFKKQSFPLEQWTKDKSKDHESSLIMAQTNNALINARQKSLEGKAKKDEADREQLQKESVELESQKITPPAYPSLFTTDTTEQRLFQKMDERNGAYAVMSGEGRPVIDAIMGKYSGDGKTGDAIYLAGISGDTITRDRVGGDKGPEERIIYGPCLNVCIMVQPDKYLEAAGHPALRASGALARILPVWLPSRVGTRFEDESDTGLEAGLLLPFQNLVKAILNHEPVKDDSGNIIPHKAKLSPDARAARRHFHNEIEKQMQEGLDLEDVRDIASKTVSQTCKLALVLHIADNPDILNTEQSEISLATWATAQVLGTYHLQEAVRVQRLASEDPILESARRIARWLEQVKPDEVTSTKIMQTGPRPRPKAKEAEKILSLLSEHGYLIEQRNDVKHRKPVYLVNPSLFSQSSQFSRG